MSLNLNLITLVPINVIDGKPEPKENYSFEIYEEKDGVWSLLPESKHYDLVYGKKYKFVTTSKYGFNDGPIMRFIQSHLQ